MYGTIDTYTTELISKVQSNNKAKINFPVIGNALQFLTNFSK